MQMECEKHEAVDHTGDAIVIANVCSFISLKLAKGQNYYSTNKVHHLHQFQYSKNNFTIEFIIHIVVTSQGTDESRRREKWLGEKYNCNSCGEDNHDKVRERLLISHPQQCWTNYLLPAPESRFHCKALYRIVNKTITTMTQPVKFCSILDLKSRSQIFAGPLITPNVHSDSSRITKGLSVICSTVQESKLPPPEAVIALPKNPLSFREIPFHDIET